MSWSKVLVMALAGALLSGPTWAQDDDDMLTPLGPSKKKPDAKPRPKVKQKPKAPPAPAKPPVTSTDDELTPLTPSKGELVLKLAAGLTTRRAKVTIDDREVGVLPIAPQSLGTGEHTIAVRAPGHATWTRKISIVANKPTDVIVALEPNAAIVSVSTDTVGAQVLINGKAVGTAPIDELEVPPGNTTIAVRKEGYRDATQTVRLVAGKEYPISVKLGPPSAPTEIIATDRPVPTNLLPTPTEAVPEVAYEESPPVYQRWYFWAGAAAVVAAVAVGSAVAVSAAQPKPLSETAICGPMGCDACIGLDCSGLPNPLAIVPFSF